MKCWLAFVLLLGLTRVVGLAAQLTRPADSLRVLPKQAARPDTTSVQQLQTQADALLARNPAQAVRLAQEALALSRQLHYPKGEGHALIGLATAARLQTNYALARRHTQQAYAVFARDHNLGGLATASLQLSLIDEVPGANLVTALREALQGMKYAEQAHRPITKLYLHYTLGDIYIQLGDYTTALAVLQTTLRDGQR